MTESEKPIDWNTTSFDGSRREQLRRTQAMSVRQRLEAMEQLTELSERMRLMPRHAPTMGIPPVVQETPGKYRADAPRNEIVLGGCTPTPLANYLKALGVLRLLSAKYPDVRGYWRGDRFVLCTTFDHESIKHFFLDEYAPTPLVAPWGARSGFYDGSSEKTAREALSQIMLSDKAQLRPFCEMIASVRALLDRHGFTEKASDEGKTELLRICRAELPDHLLEWLDVCYVLSGDGRQFPPLLGTGGNEGSGSYVSGFAQQVVACIAERKHDAALAAALFGMTTPETAEDQTPGHFSPVHGGGLNSSTGFKDDRASINSWDYILTLEGTLAFAGAAVRRGASDPFGVMSFPFTVKAVAGGSGNLAEGDMRNAPRGELWLPLWDRPSTYSEVRALTTEGRVALGRRPARDALDFVRAVHHLGGYRGIRSFQRFGLLNRKGDAYFAIPLSRVEVSDGPESALIDELDKQRWLDCFRRFASGDNAANRFLSLRKQIEDRVFELSDGQTSPGQMQSLIVLLGKIQSAIANSRKAQEAVQPIPTLSEQWVLAAEDGTPAFRIAKALAGLRGAGDATLPLRAQLFPVQRGRNKWMAPDGGEKYRTYFGRKGRLTDTMCMLLDQRLWLADRLELTDKPLDSPAGATLADIAAFLLDDGMDARIADLLPGLCLCVIPQDTDHSNGEGLPLAAFGLMKLALTPDRTLRNLGWLGEQERLPLSTAMLAQLMAGNQGNQAVQTAWRRLRSSGLTPAVTVDALPNLHGIDPLRATAALLIPLRYSAVGTLSRRLLKTAETETETA